MPLFRPIPFAVAMLVIATLCWGMGFTWAKNVGEAVNAAAGRPAGSLVGPNVMLTVRFVTAAVVWFAIFPQSRRGWTLASIRRSLVIGGLMFAGIELQHLGLDRTSEATTAFLTNLTVVLVPLMVGVAERRRPGGTLVVAVLIALAGIWLLTGAGRSGLGAGEWLGIGCAVAFSIEILALNALMPRDSVYRITGGMFVVNALGCLAFALAAPGFVSVDWPALVVPTVLVEWALLAALTTLVAFGLMNTFQPRVAPTRAAVVYLFEPIFAALYAWISEGAAMSETALMGAALIVLSNVVAEFHWPRRRRETIPPA